VHASDVKHPTPRQQEEVMKGEAREEPLFVEVVVRQLDKAVSMVRPQRTKHQQRQCGSHVKKTWQT
jgi:hypothetical protein